MKTKVKKWLSVALLAAMTAVNVQAQPAELIAGWDFEQSDLGADGIRSSETGNNYEALYEGEIEISPEGRIGSGLDASLDTDGYLFFEAEGDDNPLNIAAGNDQVSVVFWQYNRSNPNSSTFWSIGESQNRWFQAHVPWSNGNIYFDSMGCCANPTQRINGAPGEDHEWIEEWHHYAFIKNEDYKAVYVDGALLLETADGGATELTIDVTRFTIGSDNGGGNQPDAIIDQLGIFKGALTAAEIAEIAGGKSIFEPPVDTDGDGMPDGWEERYGFDPADPSDASEDPDEDGDDNLTEFTKGTDPVDTTDPTLLSVSNDCSLNTIVLEFSEKLDEASASDAGNYSIDPSVAIESIAVKKGTVTITTATQDVNAAYTVTANNIADLSKNTIPADSSGAIFTCFETTNGVLKLSIWDGIGGTDVASVFDDGRYPNDPDFVGPLFSFNTRDLLPGNGRNNFAGEIEGWITPAESGDYDFFLRSDDASELWISSDDKEANLEFQAEETGCCNGFLEVGADQTTFQPISMVAGRKYFVQVLYKEGGGGDFAQVAWRKTTDDTAAGSLQPIGGAFLSSDTPLLIAAEGSFGGRAPGAGATAAPTLETISISHNNGAAAWTADNTSLAINGNAVESAFTKEGVTATLTHTLGEELLPSGAEMTVTLTYPDPVGEPTTEAWSFNVLEYRGPIHSTVGNYPGLLTGGATSTADGGGHSGSAGDRGLDFTPDGGSVIVTEFDWLAPALANDTLTVVYWVKKHEIANSSAFWISTATAGSGNRGFQAHAPWSNNNIYFDTQGCCAAPGQRINAPVAEFDDNPDFWNDWHLMSFSKAGGVKEIRIDGDLFLDGIDADPLTDDIIGLNIGSGGDRGNPDRSIFDDFAIFDTALGEADLKSIVNGGSPADLADKGLLAYWDFNEAVSSVGDGSVFAINFGADEPDGNRSDVSGAAGILGTSNWNNVDGASGEANELIADNGGSAAGSSVSVTWASNNTWSSQGRGEENNEAAEGDDRNMMTGYLDTNNTSQTTVTVDGLPDGASYDVVVYAKGGVAGRGGEFSIGDSVITHSTEASFTGNYIYGAAGDWIVFKDVTGSSFTLTGTPTSGSPPRAPINGIEVVIGGGVEIPAPAGGIGGVSLQDGNVVIEYTGTLKSASSLGDTFSEVAGATSPYSVTPDQAQAFFIAE